MNNSETIFLSLGAGVQSTVLLMLAIDESPGIERPDHVVFADTGFEPAGVYRHVDWCERRCEENAIAFHRVKAKLDMAEEFHAFESGKKKYWNSRPPFYIETRNGLALMHRQCTKDAKIKPIERLGKRILKESDTTTAVVQIGFSTDEARRVAPSRHAWLERIYPLIDPLKMSRGDCQAWFDKRFPHVPLQASACVICPYLRHESWLNMKRRYRQDFERACEYDERIRLAYRERTKQEVFLHRSGRPLADIEKHGEQMDLDLEDEIYCSGGCGL